MPATLSKRPSRSTLPRPAKAILVAYRAATKRQIHRAAARFMRDGRARYPYLIVGGTTAVAHMRDRMVTALGHEATADWYGVAQIAAREATCARFGLPFSNRHPLATGQPWPDEARAADLALQAALLTAIAEHGGAVFDDDVRVWLVGRWLGAGLPL